jgi:hypothetical protein
MYIVNNIFSSPVFCYANTAFISGKNMVGLCDYNWVGGRYHHGVPAWFGEHNINAEGQRLWSAGEMTFILPDDSTARGSGIDLSGSFAIEGKTYEPLPGMKPGYFTGEAPDAGALQKNKDDRRSSR